MRGRCDARGFDGNERAGGAERHVACGTGGWGVDVSVALSSGADGLRVVVRDDGPGFGPGGAPVDERPGGLSIIRGLVQQLGGTVSFGDDGGAIVAVEVPRPRERRPAPVRHASTSDVA